MCSDNTATQVLQCDGCGQTIYPGQPIHELDEPTLLTTYTLIFCGDECRTEYEQKQMEREERRERARRKAC